MTPPPAGRRRRRRGGSGGAGGGGGQNQGARGPAQPQKKTIPADFWGDPAKLPSADLKVRITPEPAAIPKSLGRTPLPGYENASEHYFRAMYERAVNLAQVLAHAGELIGQDELLDD